MPTPEQLYAELYQCRMLLQGIAQRLSQLEAMMPGAGHPGIDINVDFPPRPEGGNAIGGYFPNSSGAGNVFNREFPNTSGAGIPALYDFPPPGGAGNPMISASQTASQAGNISLAEPAPTRLQAILKAKGFPPRTSRARIARGATLLLAIRRDPTKHGVAHYAKLLHMSASGAGKFMMDVRRIGLIRHKAYSVHELTPRGEELVQAALQPAAEV